MLVLLFFVFGGRCLFFVGEDYGFFECNVCYECVIVVYIFGFVVGFLVFVVVDNIYDGIFVFF